MFYIFQENCETEIMKNLKKKSQWYKFQINEFYSIQFNPVQLNEFLI